MSWILIGVIAGSLVVSGHDTKEACEGRAVTLREQKVTVKCVEAPNSGLTMGVTTLSPNFYSR